MKLRANEKILLASLSILFILSGVWFFARSYCCNYASNENRVLQSKPSFSLAGYSEYSKQYDDYFSDNMPFRSFLISVARRIDRYVFKNHKIGQVIIGDNDWLFLHDTISDYERNNLYDEETLETICNNAVAVRDYLDSMGIEFYILICPNKAEVYSSEMPDDYSVFGDISRADQLVNYLKEAGNINIIYPIDSVTDAKSLLSADDRLYYKFDTHWNYLGGYYGAKPLLKEMGSKDNFPDHITLTKEVGQKYGYDLYRMLGINDERKDDVEYSIDEFDKLYSAVSDKDIDLITTSSPSAPNRQKLFLVRDSFGKAIMPYLASSYSEIYSIHQNDFDKNQIIKEKPDILVYECVERTGLSTLNYQDFIIEQ